MTDNAAVRVQIVPVDLPPADEARCREVLDPAERARAIAFAHPADRRRYTVAHGALRLIAGRELGAPPGALAWVPGRHGKPVLTPPWSRLHTSLSHTRDLVAVAVSTARPVGVDVEQVLPGPRARDLAARFFLPEEAAYVGAAGDGAAGDGAAGDGAAGDAAVQADRFIRLWVRKEAVVKSVGGRLWPNLRVLVHRRDVVTCAEPASLCRVADLTAPAGHRAAVALAGAAPFVHEAAGWLPRDAR